MPDGRVYEHVDPSHSIRYTGRTRERAQRTGEGGEVSEITTAIKARQAQITQLQGDIETLQRAASIMGTKSTTATSQPKAKRKVKRKRRKRSAAAKGSPGQPKTTQRRKPAWSAADRRAISRRMKAYWAKRRKARQ